MMRPASHIRYHIAAIFAAHWHQFVAQHKRMTVMWTLFNASVVNVHFVGTDGTSHDGEFCALRGSWESKRAPAHSMWQCHDCHEEVVIPATYKNNHGETMKIGPKSLDPNTEVVRF